MAYLDEPETGEDVPDDPLDTSDFLSAAPKLDPGRFFIPPVDPVGVSFAGGSHRGNVRTRNEDHFIVARVRRSVDVLQSNIAADEWPGRPVEDGFLMAVADGIGGAARGELASKMTLQRGIDLLSSDVKWLLKMDHAEIAEFEEKSRAYFQMVDRALIDQAYEASDCAGMGTTLTVAYTVGSQAFIVHAGDSRAYLYRDKHLRRLTRDHTLAHELAESGEIPFDLVDRHSARHVLTNCLGGPELGVDVDIERLSLQNGDLLLLCSDGLTEMVDDQEIARILGQTVDIEVGRNVLIERALAAGGVDNITVVLAQYAV